LSKALKYGLEPRKCIDLEEEYLKVFEIYRYLIQFIGNKLEKEVSVTNQEILFEDNIEEKYDKDYYKPQMNLSRWNG
jgi:hypothetical protein